MTDTLQTPTTGSTTTEEPAQGGSDRRRRTVGLVVAGILLVAIASASFLVIDHRREQRAIAETRDAIAQLAVANAQTLAQLETSVADGAATLESATSVPGVEEESEALEAALASATTSVETGIPAEPSPEASLEELRSDLATHQDLERDLAISTSTLSTSIAVMVQAQTAWEIEEAGIAYDQAVTDLASSLEVARLVLSASEGQVADESARQALADALTAAGATQTSEPDREDLESLTGATNSHTTAQQAVDAASGAVAEAQSTWQIEQERVAAEAAAAAATARETNRQSTGSTAGSGTQKGAAKAGAGASSPQAPKGTTPPANSPPAGKVVPAPQGGKEGLTWYETFEPDDSSTCFDTAGNSWTC